MNDMPVLDAACGVDPAFLRLSDPAEAPSHLGAALALAVMRATQDAVYVMDPDGRITFVNRAGLGHLDDAQAAVRTGYWWKLWPAAVEDDLRTAVGQAAEGEEVRLTTLCPDGAGTERCHVTLCPVEDDQGRVGKLVALVRGG